MFLIKAAFWLSLVILLIPAGGEDNATPTDVAGASLSPMEAFGAARDTVADFSAFCQRNPDTCETGSAALQMLAHKAQAGAEMLYAYVAEDTPAAEDPLHARRGTLNEGDLEVPWQGPDLHG